VLLTDPHDIKDPLSDALIALSARVEELEERLGAEPCPPDPFAAEEAERTAYRVELERMRVYVTMGEGIRRPSAAHCKKRLRPHILVDG
jgi:serine O-acetyltransferase